MDESGSTGATADPQQPLHLIACIIINEEKLIPIEADLRELGIHHFGREALNTDFEFHGTEIRRGKGYFKKKTVQERITIAKSLTELVKKHDIKIGYSAVDKIKSYANQHPHRLAFLFLIERVEDFLRSINQTGLLVADQNDEIEQRLIDDLEIYKTNNTGFGYRPTQINQIVDSIHFVQSRNNRLIQLADFVAYSLSKGINVQKKLVKNYLDYSKNPSNALQYQEWLEENAKKSDSVDIEIYESLIKGLVFSKTFPQ